MFRDRTDAGMQLAKAVAQCAGGDPLVLAIPCGGVEVGRHIADRLECEMSLVIVQKLPLPDNPEAGFGAIAEDGSMYFVEHAVRCLPQSTVNLVISRQRREIHRRIRFLRGGCPLPDLADRTVIVVDDGIAMGSTMHAAVLLCQRKGAARVVAAAPVASPSVAGDLWEIADQVVVLSEPPSFHAVAQVYEHWCDVSDREVLQIMRAGLGAQPCHLNNH